MTEQTSLEKSIAHWEKNLKCALAEYADGISVSGDDCALCEEFGENEDSNQEGCSECPVAARTGKDYCCDTPYYTAREAFLGESEWHVIQAQFQNELDFLKSLRPESAVSQ